MNFSTKYLGLKLKNPLVASASPLSQNLENVQRMADAGLAAIVLHSLFEEQIVQENLELVDQMERGTDSYAEALTYFPEPREFSVGPEKYLEHISKAKKLVDIPIIASLNGYTSGGWTKWAKLIQDAGADALELNIYFVPTSLDENGQQVEQSYIDILRMVKANVSIPVAVKLSPFFSSMAHFAKQLDSEGVNGLVLFNRFYQPDIDLEHLEIIPNLLLSTPASMRLPLRWIAILYGKLKADMAAVGGIHQASDVLKMIMAGASVTMLCSTFYRNKIDQAKVILEDMRVFMEEHEYDSIEQMRGSMSQRSCADPEAFERSSYVRAIRSDKLLRIGKL